MADTEKKVVDEQTTEKKPRKKRATTTNKKTDTPAKVTSDNKSAGKKSTTKKTAAKKVEPKEVDKEIVTPEKVEEPKKVVKEEKSEVESKRILLTYPTPVYRAPGKQFYCEDAIGYAIFNGVVQNGFAQVKYGHDWRTGYIDVSVVGR